MNKNFSDILNLLSKLTLRRIANSMKVFLGYYLSRLTGKPLVWGLPFSLTIEPTTSCNLRCPECPSGLRSFTRPTGMLTPDLLKNVVDQVARDSMYIIFYFQGEPYLHKNFTEMVAIASSRNLYTATSTNAHYLDPENARKTVKSGLDRLIISIDGTTQEVYEQYRIGGLLSKVLEGTANIVRAKKELRSKTPYIVLQFLVVAPNEHQIDDARKLAKELGVDNIAFKTAQIYDYENGNSLIPKNENYSRYRYQDGKYSLKNKLLNHCWKVWQSAVVTWDGTIVPCCFDKDAKHPVGTLSTHSLKSIWQGKAYTDFRASLLKSRSEIDICTNCSEGTRVWETN